MSFLVKSLMINHLIIKGIIINRASVEFTLNEK